MATACPVFEEKVDCNKNDERQQAFPLVSCPGLKHRSLPRKAGTFLDGKMTPFLQIVITLK